MDPAAPGPGDGTGDESGPPTLRGPLEDDPERWARIILEGPLTFGEHDADPLAAVARFGKAAVPAAPYLRDHLLEEADGYPERAARALVGMGQEAVPYLVEALTSEHVDSRKAVLWAIRDHGRTLKGLATALLECLDDEDVVVRCTAADALAALGANSKDVLRALKDRAAAGEHRGPPCRSTRFCACRALRDLGADDAETLAIFEACAVAEDDDALSAMALEAFLARSPDRRRALALAERLRSRGGATGTRALTTLVEAGSDAPDVIEAYLDTLPWRPTHEQKLAAAETVVKTGPNGRKAAIDYAFVVLDWGGHEGRKIRAAAVLAQTGPEGRAEPAVAEALWVHANPDNETAPVVEACRKALRALGLPLSDPKAALEHEGSEDDDE